MIEPYIYLHIVQGHFDDSAVDVSCGTRNLAMLFEFGLITDLVFYFHHFVELVLHKVCK